MHLNSFLNTGSLGIGLPYSSCLFYYRHVSCAKFSAVGSRFRAGSLGTFLRSR